MKPLNKVYPVSELQSNAEALLTQLETTREPIMISVDGQVRVVMQEIASYEEMQEQLALLRRLISGQQQITEGKVTDHDSFFAELQALDAEPSLAD